MENVLMCVSKHSRKEISKKKIYTINIFINIQLMNYQLLNRKNLYENIQTLDWPGRNFDLIDDVNLIGSQKNPIPHW